MLNVLSHICYNDMIKLTHANSGVPQVSTLNPALLIYFIMTASTSLMQTSKRSQLSQ